MFRFHSLVLEAVLYFQGDFRVWQWFGFISFGNIFINDYVSISSWRILARYLLRFSRWVEAAAHATWRWLIWVRLCIWQLFDRFDISWIVGLTLSVRYNLIQFVQVSYLLRLKTDQHFLLSFLIDTDVHLSCQLSKNLFPRKTRRVNLLRRCALCSVVADLLRRHDIEMLRHRILIWYLCESKLLDRRVLKLLHIYLLQWSIILLDFLRWKILYDFTTLYSCLVLRKRLI